MIKINLIYEYLANTIYSNYQYFLFQIQYEELVVDSAHDTNHSASLNLTIEPADCS